LAVFQMWKAPHLIKGGLTYLPVMNYWRQRRAATGGSDSARYCYSVWLRHLSVLAKNGFHISGAHVGELGPGDSIGTGMAALISGAETYVGLDLVPFSAKANLTVIFDELVASYRQHEDIPDDNEFPRVRPKLDSYVFPEHLIDCVNLASRAKQVRHDIASETSTGTRISYRAPWNSPEVIAEGSLDLIFSQAVLEHVDELFKTYIAMYAWLKIGGFASHVIDFGAHHLSPFWNGHWAYKDLEWDLVRGRREWLLNREPLSSHLDYARRAGFEILEVMLNSDVNGLARDRLAPRYQQLTDKDGCTRGAVLILRKSHQI
jgi:hypothetical protein